MKKTADNIRIIGKSDGPTSVFIAGKDKKKTLRQKIEKSMYDFRRKRVIKFLRADPHTVDEVADYVVRELGYTEVNSEDEEYQTEYSNLRASFLLQYRPELLGDLTEPQRPPDAPPFLLIHGTKDSTVPFSQSLILIFICTGKPAGSFR